MNDINNDYKTIWNHIQENLDCLEDKLIACNWAGSKNARAAARIPILLAKSIPSPEEAEIHDIVIICGELVRGNLEVFSRDRINGKELIKIASPYYYGEAGCLDCGKCIELEEISPKQFYYYTLEKIQKILS